MGLDVDDNLMMMMIIDVSFLRLRKMQGFMASQPR